MSRSLSSLKEFDDSYYRDDINILAGVDEVGRGCLAGPVVAAAVIFPRAYNNKEINDSKLLSAKKRSELFEDIVKNAISYSVSFVDAPIIDEINILNATKLAMTNAIKDLKHPCDLVLVDAIKSLPVDNKVIGIIKGDAKSLSIAAASIIAKVTRDRYMDALAKKYPNYQFSKNKGYGTKEHLRALEIYGPIKGIHRFSFKPINFIPLF